MKPFHRNRRRHRRGVAALLAMLFLILFSVMVLGFFSTVTTSRAVAGADQNVARSMLCAESGMEFMRLQMSQVSIPPGTAEEDLIDAVYTDLAARLNGTDNLKASNGGTARTLGNSSGVISVPAGTNEYISLGGTSKFRATIRMADTAPTDNLIVHLVGMHGSKSIARAIEMRFTARSDPGVMFEYAMASSGTIQMKKGTVTDLSAGTAGLMSTSSNTPAISITGGTVEGDLAVSTDKSHISVTGGTVSGSSSSTTILDEHAFVIPAPSPPVFDTSPYAAYATNTWTTSASSPFINTRVPPSNNPSFKTGDVIEGILYIQSPNKVEFKGTVTIKGMIIFEAAGNDAINTLEFKGSAEILPLPSDAAYDALRAITGIGIMAPTTAITMKGETDAHLEGSLICSKFSFEGNADLYMDNGSLIATSTATDAVVLEGKTITFNGTGADNPPVLGVSGPQSFVPQPRTYVEVAP